MIAYSDFGWVRRGKKGGVDEAYLFVIDKPKNETEENDPKIKTPGGNNPTGNIENFLSQKIRQETGISTILVGKKRDSLGNRKSLVQIKTDGHVFRIWEMEVSSFEEKDFPVSGKNIKDSCFLSVFEIIQMRNDGKILDNHSLVVDQEIMSRFV